MATELEQIQNMLGRIGQLTGEELSLNNLSIDVVWLSSLLQGAERGIDPLAAEHARIEARIALCNLGLTAGMVLTGERGREEGTRAINDFVVLQDQLDFGSPLGLCLVVGSCASALDKALKEQSGLNLGAVFKQRRATS